MEQNCHSNGLFFSPTSQKGDLYKLRRFLVYQMSLQIYVSLLRYEIYSPVKREVMFWKTSSLQGIVRPPMG